MSTRNSESVTEQNYILSARWYQFRDMLVFLFIGFVWFLVQHASSVSILEFGAVPYRENNDACHANTQALESAFLHANSSLVDRTVKVPTGLTFCIFAAEISHMHKVTLQLDGVLVISKNQTEWRKGVVDFTAALNFLECRGLTLQGEGGVDGQGYGWWWNAILDPANGKRPHMLWIYGSQDVVVRDLYFHNSPNFHCRIYDVQHLHIQNITIHVNVTAQREISQHFGMWYEPAELEGRVGLPTFPLNTDGIDVNGNDILIEDSSIQNFDDAIVVKPNDETSYWGVCAENVFVRNIKVTFGVGMSIGSIGPGTTNPCIRNVTFENIDFDAPLKGVYIKTNPGDQGQGSVSDITYRNLTMRGALWYPIWIGPQQVSI